MEYIGNQTAALCMCHRPKGYPLKVCTLLVYKHAGTHAQAAYLIVHEEDYDVLIKQHPHQLEPLFGGWQQRALAHDGHVAAIGPTEEYVLCDRGGYFQV